MIPGSMEPIAERRTRDLPVVVGICLLLGAALAPTLDWPEFAGGGENLVIATALEMHRTGNWLIPTLQGEPRIAKPPLAAWLAAASMDRRSLREINSPDLAVREAAYRRLSWEVRWPALVCVLATVAAVYALGRVLGDGQIAATAALVYGSCYSFIRFGRAATTDVQLALWVTLANVFLAQAIFQGKRWSACLGAGLAMGLAFMSKGPVALVQSVAPAMVFVGWRRFADRRADLAGAGLGMGGMAPQLASEPVKQDGEHTREGEHLGMPSGVPLGMAPGGEDGGRVHPPYRALGGEDGGRVDPPYMALERGSGEARGSWRGPILVGVGAFLAVALPWFVVVAVRINAWGTWWREVTRREDATNLPPDAWYKYLIIVPFLFPWLIFFVIGLIGAGASLRRRAADARRVLALLLVLIPVLIMSFFRDRKERYLLPMIGPAAILAAYAVRDFVQRKRQGDRAAEALGKIQWWMVGVAAIGFPLAAAGAAKVLPLIGAGAAVKGFSTISGEAWLGWVVALATAGAAAAAILIGARLYRRWPGALVGGTVAAMLVLQAAFMFGYSRSSGGCAEMRPLAEMIWKGAGAAPAFSYRPGQRAPEDLSIYLNREVRPLSSLGAVPAADRAQVLVVYQDKREAMAVLAAEWEHFASIPRGRGFWHAYRRPPR